jgi:two-component system, NtrC family, response regulator GlrR
MQPLVLLPPPSSATAPSCPGPSALRSEYTRLLIRRVSCECRETLLHGKGTHLVVQKLLIAENAEEQRILEKLSKVVTTDTGVLISGPVGLGRDLYARYIHQCSPRCKAPFVPINCGAFPVDSLENDLFGHVNGTHTGARPQSNGLVDTADGGTLFFDEVDSLTLICQVKLLRFLQEKDYRLLGETRIRRANVCIIATINTDPVAAVRDGRLCADLFNSFTHVQFRSMSVNTRHRQLVFVVR